MRAVQTRTGSGILAVFGLVLLLAQPAVASGPEPAGGTFVATTTPTSVRTADGNTFITAALSEVITGTYTGTTSGVSFLLIRADGSANLHGSFVCVCTVAGRGSGTLEFRFAGTGTATTLEGQYRIVGSSGGLAGAHGLGRFSVTGSAGTYSGTQHYDP